MNDFFKDLTIDEVIEFKFTACGMGVIRRSTTGQKFEIWFPQRASRATVSSVASRLQLIMKSWNQGLYTSKLIIVTTHVLTEKGTNLKRSVSWLNNEGNEFCRWSEGVEMVQWIVRSPEEHENTV